MYLFEHTQILKATPRTLVDYFSDVANLDTNTPAFFRIQLLEGRPGGQLEPDQFFKYKFKLFGIGFIWVTKIDLAADNGFVDSQQEGPYKTFRHIHSFIPLEDSTLMVDRIEYTLGFSILNPLVNSLVVRPMLSSIFRYRAGLAADRFGELRHESIVGS